MKNYERSRKKVVITAVSVFIFRFLFVDIKQVVCTVANMFGTHPSVSKCILAQLKQILKKQVWSLKEQYTLKEQKQTCIYSVYKNEKNGHLLCQISIQMPLSPLK